MPILAIASVIFLIWCFRKKPGKSYEFLSYDPAEFINRKPEWWDGPNVETKELVEDRLKDPMN